MWSKLEYLRMWDIVVLTAGNVKQKADFELYLKSLDLSQYAGEVIVIADDLEDVKIGMKIQCPTFSV